MRYFIVKYFKKPNGKFSEQAKSDTKVRNADLRTASVILDYKEQKVVKFNLDENHEHRDFATLNKFFKGHYTGLISQLEAKYEILEAVEETVKDLLAETPEDAGTVALDADTVAEEKSE